MTQIKNVIRYLETIAPSAYQESYDNSGLLVGERDTTVTGIILSLDCTESVISEAIEQRCNLVISHHPIVFKGLKRLTGKTYVERTIIKAIQSGIAIYAMHTNLDHVPQGVNWMLAERLGLQGVKVLAPKKHILSKLTAFVPSEYSDKVLDALYQAGAGAVGHYSECSFQVDGLGTFKPGAAAHPFIGQAQQASKVPEKRIELLFPSYLETEIVESLKKNHPYEEVAYYVQRLENENQEVGAGAIGTLARDYSVPEFLEHVKTRMNLSVIKYTPSQKSTIRKVAVCGGAGSFLLPHALAEQADAFVTSDYKYHEFFDAENQITLCDIGHYESEVFTKHLLLDHLSKKFDNFALHLSTTNTNPVLYYL